MLILEVENVIIGKLLLISAFFALLSFLIAGVGIILVVAKIGVGKEIILTTSIIFAIIFYRKFRNTG